MNVIAKYMKNPFGQQVLINELIGSCLADSFGINVPKFGIGILSEEVVCNTNQNEDINESNAGPCFFSEYHSKSVPFSKRLVPRDTEGLVERIVLFDNIIGNHDRHMGNLLIDSTSKRELYIIDHSHIFGPADNIRLSSSKIENELKKDTILNGAILRDNKDLYSRLISHMGFDNQRLKDSAEEFGNIFSKDLINDIFCLIPKEWTNWIEDDILNGIAEMICTKMNMIDDICEMIIRERGLVL